MSDDVGAESSTTDEERASAVREQIKRLRVLDVAYEMMISLVTVGYQKLGLTDQTRELRDLADARLAIELLRAVLEVAEKEPEAVQLKDLRSTLAQLQLSYAHVVQLGGAESATSSASPTQTADKPAACAEEPTGDTPSTNDVETERSDARRPAVEGAPEASAVGENASHKAAPAKADQAEAAPKAPVRKRAAPKTAPGKRAAPKKVAPRRPRGGATPPAD